MADVLSAGTMFPHELVEELISKVVGKSSLAKLSDQMPIAFSGTDLFTFTLDKEVDIVAENGAKGKGGATAAAITIKPIKFEYGARVSDEFVKCSDEKRLQYLRTFIDGYAKKMARGFDIGAFHGYNPRTGTASTVIGNNHLDYAVTQASHIVTATNDANADIESAVALLGDHEATGIVVAPAEGQALAALKANGAPLFPELAWGANPERINGLDFDRNSTVAANSNTALAYVGNFRDYFKWGYAQDVTLEVIEYGNPDNDATLGDLKGHNQVYIRAEMYLGWGILDNDAFAEVKSA